MNTRLKQFLSAENITQAQFADTINVVRASVSHVLSGRNNPSFDFIKAMMQHYPNLNIEWLMFGKGRMYKDVRQNESRQIYSEEILFPQDPENDISIDDSSENSAQYDELHATNASSDEFDTLNSSIQRIETQRKVSKIIILFDDGTYQEM